MFDTKIQDYFSKHPWLLRYAAVFFFVAISCAGLNPRFNWVDDSYYIVLAKALASGQGYTNINLPQPTPHTHFPPGLPVLLSLLMVLKFPLAITIITSKVILIAYGAAALLAFGYLARLEGYDEFSTTWAIVLSSVSVVLVTYTVRVASELPYMLLSILALIAVARYRRSTLLSWWGPLASILLAVALLTRSIGIVLIGAVFIDLAIRREFKRLMPVIGPAAIIMLAWFWHTHGSTGTVGYFKEFRFYRLSGANSPFFGAFAEPASNAWALLNLEIPRTIASVLSSQAVLSRPALAALTLPLRLAISSFTLFQIVRSRSKADSAARWYLGFYLLLVLAYPWEPSRFLVPIAPFLCLYFVGGARGFFERVRPRSGSRAFAGGTVAVSAILVVCLSSALASDAHFAATAIRNKDFSSEAASTWTNALDGYRWLDENTSASSTIGCVPTIEANIYLLAARKAMPLPASADAWRPAGIDYIVVLDDRSTYGSVERRVENRVLKTLHAQVKKAAIIPVYQNNTVTKYKL